MGSVKDLQVMKPPMEFKMGVGRFVFGDSTSVFDWKRSVVDIPFKGAALCIMAAAAFEKLKKKNVLSHYRGLIDANEQLTSVNDLKIPTNVMEIDLVNVLKPKFIDGKYDYSVFTSALRNFLIPLEFVYRNSLPAG